MSYTTLPELIASVVAGLGALLDWWIGGLAAGDVLSWIFAAVIGVWIAIVVLDGAYEREMRQIRERRRKLGY